MINKEEKVLEGEVMSEEELEKSRSARALLDSFCSPAVQDYISGYIFEILKDSSRD